MEQVRRLPSRQERDQITRERKLAADTPAENVVRGWLTWDEIVPRRHRRTQVSRKTPRRLAA
jgi:hypothetical protein